MKKNDQNNINEFMRYLRNDKPVFDALKKISKRYKKSENIDASKRIPSDLLAQLIKMKWHYIDEIKDPHELKKAKNIFKTGSYIDKRFISNLDENMIMDIRMRISKNKEVKQYLQEYNNYMRLLYKLGKIKRSADLDKHYQELSDYIMNKILSQVQIIKIRNSFKND